MLRSNPSFPPNWHDFCNYHRCNGFTKDSIYRLPQSGIASRLGNWEGDDT